MNPIVERRHQRALLAVGLSALSGLALAGVDAAVGLTAGDLPFAGTLSVLMPAGSIAGMQVSIARFDTPLSVPQALAQAERAWSRDGRSAVVRASAGPWETLSTHRAGTTLTLQTRALADGTAQGLLSRWNHAANPAVELAHRLHSHLPAGARVLRSLAGDDHGAHSTTIVATIGQSLHDTRRALEASLPAAGFKTAPPAAAGGLPPNTWAGYFNRVGTDLAVTLSSADGQTDIVMHIREFAR